MESQTDIPSRYLPELISAPTAAMNPIIARRPLMISGAPEKAMTSEKEGRPAAGAHSLHRRGGGERRRVREQQKMIDSNSRDQG